MNKKTLRYYYWLLIEFIKKNLKILLLSFFLSFILIIGAISFSPYIDSLLFTKRNVIGTLGNYDFNSLPQEITSKISNGLVFINEKGEIIPALASSWEVSKDGKEYRFHLKSNLLWSNGKKFTAKEVSYNFKDVQSRSLDDQTIYFKLAKPLPIFPTYLNKPLLKNPLLGVAGIYKVDVFKVRYGSIKELSLSPNKEGLPHLRYKFYDSESQLINAYKKGEIKEFTSTKKSVVDIFSQWKNSEITKSVDYTRLLTFFFNLNSPILKEKEIREAVNSAVDRSNFKELGEPAISSISPASWAYDTKVKNPLFDPAGSEKIIKKSLTATESAELNFYTYYDYFSVAEVIAESLRKIGLKVNLKLITFEKPSDFDLFLAFWNVPTDPDQYFFWHSTQTQGNIGNYKNVKIDKLLEDGRSTLSLRERKKFYQEFQKVLADDPPAIFLYFPYVYTIGRN
ncbi:ABC transporter substrate-binding protein [Candidatus Roizmanbacteria bacterium]|nr:ABC transporter substrate-binding protein [Candidatus Roizmanbacteria bacterium]